ncbi:MAG: glutathione peroxidase [Pseudomonadota bacterium]
MRQLLALSVVLALFACTGDAEPKSKSSFTKLNNTGSAAVVYNIDFQSIRGEPMPFETFKGKVVLVVNTASRCGYTGQYAGLQELYDTFKDEGLVVLGAPANNFGGQEPGTEEQIKSFCEINYGVDFPLTSKVEAVGPNQHQFWREAKAALGDKAEPKWNFHKVLVGRDGSFIQAYPSAIRPADGELVADIERALAG